MRYMAFLRAINVGGRTVKMDRLRSLFESLGYANVDTFIASGNLVFETEATDVAALAQAIEHQLHDALGFDVDTLVRTAAEVAGVAAYAPFSAAELADADNQLYVAFLSVPPDADSTGRLLDLRNEVDDFHVNGAEAYWLRRRAVGESAFTGAALEKALGAPATMRNINTVRRMAKKYPPSDSSAS